MPDYHIMRLSRKGPHSRAVSKSRVQIPTYNFSSKNSSHIIWFFVLSRLEGLWPSVLLSIFNKYIKSPRLWMAFWEQVLVIFQGNGLIETLIYFPPIIFLRTIQLPQIQPGHEKTCPIPYANNIEADQPSAFFVRCLNSIYVGPVLALSKISRL